MGEGDGVVSPILQLRHRADVERPLRLEQQSANVLTADTVDRSQTFVTVIHHPLLDVLDK